MNRRGVTLVELLITVAVVGALAGLILPAAQKVRSAAARVACANNLKQLGVALHHHHAAVGRLPPGRGTPAPAIFSAHAHLLPYLEQDAVRARIDYASAPATYTVPPATVHDGNRNLAAASTPVKAFVCPADPAGGRVAGSAFAGANYAGNAGTGDGPLAAADGVFYLGSAVRFIDVADGTSATAAFAERPLGGPDDPRRLMLEVPAGAATTPAGCGPGAGVWNPARGEKWVLGNYGNTLYNHADGPDPDGSDCLSATQQQGRVAARGLHPCGAAVLVCDGGVRPVAAGVTLDVWRALATRAGGESAGD